MDMIEMLKGYIKPELVIVAIALYFLAEALKGAELVKAKYIPLVLGIIGIVIAMIWTIATSIFSGYQSVLMMIFTSIVQGILVAGLSVYVNQLIKQAKKEE